MLNRPTDLGRVPPLPPSARRATLIAATFPLVHGAELTDRQSARAAGCSPSPDPVS